MPASFSPAPNSMASLSIDEANAGAASTNFAGTSTSLGAALETATPTVPCIPISSGTEQKSEDSLMGGGGMGVAGLSDDKDSKKGCKKKVGLTGFTCRCGGLFCSIHRYSDKHECGFDYKALGAEEISKSNPVVVAQKVAKI